VDPMRFVPQRAARRNRPPSALRPGGSATCSVSAWNANGPADGSCEPRTSATAKIVRVPISRSRLDLDQRHLRHRAARRRAAFRAGRLAAGAAALGLGLGNLLRLRRDRAVQILETELLDAGFVLDRDDAHVAAALELAEQDLVGERLLDILLDEARHR